MAQRYKYPEAQRLQKGEGNKPYGPGTPTGQERAGDDGGVQCHHDREGAPAGLALFDGALLCKVTLRVHQLEQPGEAHAAADQGADQHRWSSRSSSETPGPKASMTPGPFGASGSHMKRLSTSRMATDDMLPCCRSESHDQRRSASVRFSVDWVTCRIFGPPGWI